ncbi:MAG: glycosyltransferase [Deltaproteobacteria bacterium]|nr:glycosyltransferase [Deltaproteobacteria bacterium]
MNNGQPIKHSSRVARADLHLHSKYSNRPSEWFLRRIGAPESFTEPKEIYRQCRNAGMDYVTIADHNSIRGALEISDLPGTFLSSELTTYFPENGAKLHCLVSGITSRQFEDLQKARENIYDLQAYLIANQIFHAVAHPLYRVNDRLTVDNFEKLILLFNCFEGINGSRNGRACAVAAAIFQALDKGIIEELADRHGIPPTGPTPWQKTLTGGSDDHGGLYCAGAFTETPQADTVFDFLEHLRAGRCRPGGGDGSSLQLAHSLIHIAHTYLRNHLGRNCQGASLASALLRNLAGLQEEQQPVSPLRAAVRRLAGPLVRRYRLRQMSETERLLIEEFQSIAGQAPSAVSPSSTSPAERFALFSRLVHQLSLVFLKRALERLKEGSLLEGFQALGSLAPVLLGVAPYLTAFSTQHKDDPFLRELCALYPGGQPALQGRGGRAWVTDTLRDINGVARTIHRLAGLAHSSGLPLTVLTTMGEKIETPFPIRNFEPLESFSLPEYPELTFAVPPVLDILRYLEDQDFEEIIISTPGPMGLTALFASQLLGIPVKGIYHTDFPYYIEKWTEDETMGEATRRFMSWFYGRMRTVFAPTEAYVGELVRLGLERSHIEVLPRGVDLHDFNPGFRNEGFFDQYGLNGSDFKFIYVGRVSAEKNIEVLLQAFRLLGAEGHSAELAVVGDGPGLKALKTAYGDTPGLAFTGYLEREALATAFASAHALVFPSTSDTFGNVVLEAHASGLPAIVSDRGGPQEIVRAYDSGLVVNADRPEPVAEAMRDLMTDRQRYRYFCERAMASAAGSSWDTLLEKLCPPSPPGTALPAHP